MLSSSASISSDSAPGVGSDDAKLATPRVFPGVDWLTLCVHAIAWVFATAFALLALGREMGIAIGLLGAVCLTAIVLIQRMTERRRWVDPIHELLSQVRDSGEGRRSVQDVSAMNPELAELARAVVEIRGKLTSIRDAGRNGMGTDTPFILSGEFETARLGTSPVPILSRSSLGHAANGVECDPLDAPGGEMINRLEPDSLRWIESSVAEQAFLGRPLAELRAMSLLDIIDPEDRDLARDQLAAAIAKGEGHNLLYRVRTAAGEVKAVELHVAVRYSADARPHHVRVRLADMTKKVRAERELRRRTKELIDVNSQLRRINRELEQVKNRYSDLYHNAPAMYFSINADGVIVECNETLLLTIERERDEVVGRPYTILPTETRKASFGVWFEDLKRTGRVELESRWIKKSGGVMDVWLSSTAVRGSDGSFRYTRSVARDVTARRALEAELKDKNDRLARANVELSAKNKELDQFAYIIAHDLKEPLRTLIAFSDFLEKDCGDRLDDAGRDYLRHIVDASRRMRALISDLQTLGRAGRVAGDFARVRLDQVVETIRLDFAELLRSRGAEVRTLGKLPEIWGDRNRLGQLLGNLIGNGLKYNASDRPFVEVAAVASPDGRMQPGFATIAVRDNGIGIAPEFHARVFELFRRLHTREEYEGTGAGLAICQKIATAHGGRIWLESAPGTGSTFLVNLPLASDQAPNPDDAWHAV